MRPHLRCGIVALMLLAGPALAPAQVTTTGVDPAHPELSFSIEQERIIWNQLGNIGNQRAPSGYFASIGMPAPRSIRLHELPSSLIRKIPASRGMRYAKVGDEVLIVDPGNRLIVDVVSE